MERIQSILENANAVGVWDILAFVGIVISLGLVVYQLRLIRFKNMLDVFDRFRDRWDSQPVNKAKVYIAAYYLKILPYPNTVTRDEEPLFTFFEEMGLYLRHRIIDRKMTWELFSHHVENYWNIMQQYVRDFRQNQSDESYFTEFEYAYQQMGKLSAAHPSAHGSSKSQLEREAFAWRELILRVRRSDIESVIGRDRVSEIREQFVKSDFRKSLDGEELKKAEERIEEILAYPESAGESPAGRSSFRQLKSEDV